jgi:PAS domain S-box-containing protein
MDNKVSDNIRRSRTSLRNNIVLSFFLVLTLSGITINIIFQSVIQKALSSEGLGPDVIEHISRNFIIIGSGVTVSGTIIILCIAFFLSQTITRPLKKLTHGMFEIAKGAWNTRIEINSHDEVGQLAQGFNFMAARIEESLEKLRTAKEYIENVVDSVPSILIILSDRLNILSTNKMFDKLNEQFPSLTIKQFITPLENEIKKNLESGETLKKEFSIVPERSDVNLIFSAVISRIGQARTDRDNDEKPVVLLTIMDITERTKMKEMVLQSKQDWEDTFNALPDMITIHDKDFNIIQANRAAQEILKLPFISPGAINKCYKYFHGSDVAPKDCKSCQCMVTAQPATFEIFEPHLEKYIELRSIPRINGQNELIGLIHVVRDITQRKQIEEEHNQLLKVVTRGKIEWEVTFDTVTDFIILIDKEFKIRRCNSSFAQYAGVPVSKLVNTKYYEYFSPIDPKELTHCEELIRKEEPMDRIEMKTNDEHWFYVSQRPIHDKKGNYLHTVVIATDITDLKNTQQKLKQSEQDLKQQVEDLEKFYDMAVGRELKMKELKKEIKRINAELSRYKEHELIKT